MSEWRHALQHYLTQHAQPRDKFSHQPRLYALACRLAGDARFDDDILFAACWLHDLGVFIGHRPADPVALAQWDNVAYAVATVPQLLTRWGFAPHKIGAVQEAIAQHHPQARPTAIEAQLLHDADLLEQLGAIGLLRSLSKVGRDTRYATFSQILPVLEQALQLAPHLLLPQARIEAEPKLALLRAFLQAAQAESEGLPL